MWPSFLSKAKEWSPEPFKLDALGLVSLLGSNEVDCSLGRLTHRGFAEHLPLLASFVVATDQYTDKIPGFGLYNITDAIFASDVSGWFGRWILSENMSYTSATIRIDHNQEPWYRHVTPAMGGFVVNFIVVALAVLQRDNVAIAHALATLFSVVASAASVICKRRSVATLVNDMKTEANNNPSWHYLHEVWAYIVLPTGNRAQIVTQRGILRCLLQQAKPKSYIIWMIRSVAWICFATQAVTLGSCNMVYQIIIIFTLILSTLLTHLGWAEDRSCIAGCLKLTVEDNRSDEGNDNPINVYARMKLDKRQERSMIRWGLFPHKRNENWWVRYDIARQRAMGDDGVEGINAHADPVPVLEEDRQQLLERMSEKTGVENKPVDARNDVSETSGTAIQAGLPSPADTSRPTSADTVAGSENTEAATKGREVDRGTSTR